MHTRCSCECRAESAQRDWQREGERNTVVGHVEGGESGVGVREHGVDGSVSVDAAPPSAGLPHPVEHPAYRQRVLAVVDGRYPRRLR